MAYLSIKATAENLESYDLVDMMQRMYVRWAEQHRFKTEVLDYVTDNFGGYKSCLWLIQGERSFDWLRSEPGIHKFTRVSPFDNKGRRHTSFVRVDLWPDSIDTMELDERTLSMSIQDTSRGGQQVQLNRYGVTVTHIPSNTTANSRTQRTITKNRQVAMLLLRMKLFAWLKVGGDDPAAHLFQVIRSYIFHPYKMVKDHRTDYETDDIIHVLDGGLDPLMKQYAQKMGYDLTEKENGV